MSEGIYVSSFKIKWALKMSQAEFQTLFKAAPKISDDLAILVDKKKLNSHDPTLRGAIFELEEKYLIILEDSSIECLVHELEHYDLYKLVGVEGANFMLDNASREKQVEMLWENIWKINQ